jgi:hypothetical protein
LIERKHVYSYVSSRHDAYMRCEIVAYIYMRPDKKEPRHYLAYAKPPPQSDELAVFIMFNHQMHKIFINTAACFDT